MSAIDQLITFGAPLQAVAQGVNRARGFLKSQAQARTVYQSSTLTPDNPALTRHSVGAWAGSYTLPPASLPIPYTPVLLQEPVNWPLDPTKPADFTGRVDFPFISMEGFAGYDGTPPTEWPSGGTRWGSYFIYATSGATVLRTKIPPNGIWTVSTPTPPATNWSFQIVTYPTQADYDADTNRSNVGNPWLQSQRPGDVRQYYTIPYAPQPPQFTNVSIIRGGGNVTVQGTLQPFTFVAGNRYAIVVTDEVDVEYCWAFNPAVGGGAFSITRALPLGTNVKLRLLRQTNAFCNLEVIGQVWCALNAGAGGSVYADLQVEYRSITALVPYQPDVIQPAQTNLSWNFTLPPGIATAQARLVNTNTKRIYGQYTMPSGVLRSYNVPATDFSQNIAGGVYYEEFNDSCALYDQAVALIAMLQTGEKQMAANLIQALIDCQKTDGSWVFAVDQAALLTVQDYVRTGAVAWVVYALELAAQSQFASWALPDATLVIQNCLAFIETYSNDLGLINGGKGTPEDPNFIVPWWSSEHNFDCWWAFNLAAQLYNWLPYQLVADTIRGQLTTDDVGWDATNGIFWQGGIVADGANTPDGMHALDMHSWGGVLLYHWNNVLGLEHAMARAYDLYYVTDDPTGWSGFTTFIAADGYPPETIVSPWYEGSYGCVLAVRLTDPVRANGLMRTLSYAQLPDGSYHYTLEKDPVNEIQTFPSMIAAAWNICAYSGPGTPYDPVLWVV